jgi:hypothetical protein
MGRRAVVAGIALLGGIVAVVLSMRASPPDAPTAGPADAQAPDDEGRRPGEVRLAAPKGRSPAIDPARVAAATATKPAKAAPGEVSGVLLGPDGCPLVGARVTTAGSAGEAATTDTEGRFSLHPKAPASVVYVTGAGSFQPFVVSLADLRGGPVDLSRLVIAGTAVDADSSVGVSGLPLEIAAATTPHAAFAGGTTGADGSFRFVPPQRGEYVVRVPRFRAGPATPPPADEYRSHESVRATAGSRGVELRVRRGFAIDGVLLAADGTPVARAFRVDAIGRTARGDPDYAARRGLEVVDPAGRFRLAGLAAGRYDLWIGEASPAGAPTEGHRATFTPTVVRDVAAGGAPVTVRLADGRPIRGRLVGSDGTEIRGPGMIFVYLASDAGRTNVIDVAAPDGSGGFETDPLDPVERYDVLAQFPGSIETWARGLSAGDAEVVLVLPTAKSISGRVLDADERPVGAGVSVGVVATNADPRASGGRAFARTDSDGTFRADGLLDATFVVEAGGGPTGLLGGAVSGVKAGATDVVLHVRTGVAISGTLVDEQGAPVAVTSLQADDGARQAAMRPYVQVGADGRFELRGLRAGEVRLSAMIGGVYRSLGTATAPASDLRVLVADR